MFPSRKVTRYRFYCSIYRNFPPFKSCVHRSNHFERFKCIFQSTCLRTLWQLECKEVKGAELKTSDNYSNSEPSEERNRKLMMTHVTGSTGGNGDCSQRRVRRLWSALMHTEAKEMYFQRREAFEIERADNVIEIIGIGPSRCSVWNFLIYAV